MAGIARFNPRNTYRPKSGKKAKSSSSQAPKRQRSKSSDTSHSSERKSVKDVILLPGPRVKCVPKGVAREELHVRGFTTTFELSSSMNEKEIRAILAEKLKYKLGNRLGPKFIFLRTVSNKIIVPTLSENERFDGRMIKHFAGQGPVYIRVLRDISSTLTHGHWKRLDPDSISSGEESEKNPGL